MASTLASTYHPGALYPCRAAPRLRQVPESIRRKGPEIWVYDRSRGSGEFLTVWLFQVSAVVLLDRWRCRLRRLRQACTAPVRAIIATSLTRATACELSDFPCSCNDFHTINGDQRHSGRSHGHPRPHGVLSDYSRSCM